MKYLSPGTHGVVIVHGIGEQRRGDTLAAFAKALCDILINSPKGTASPAVQLKSDVSGSPPSVTLQITSPYGEQATWLCREAFWNDAFPPPSATQVLWWGLNQNLRNQLSAFLRLWRDPANEDLPTETERQKETAKVKSGTATTPVVKQGRKPKAQVRVRSGVLSGIVLIPLVPLTYLLLGLTWILHIIPSIGPLDKFVSWVRKFDPALSSSLGDVQMYVDHQIWSANARARLENIVIAMLEDKTVEDITIVAHSMGSIVAYDALTEGGNIAEAIVRDDVFTDTERLAYRLNADTVLATLGYNLAFGERHALDLSWRWVQTAIDQPGSAGADTIRYYVNQLSVAYLVRF